VSVANTDGGVCVWGVEYDSPDGSSRPPVLCDPSSPPCLVVGDAVRADARDGDG